MKSCYIAGPMRGYPEYNYPAFYAAEEKLVELGWTVHNPARMDAKSDTEVDYTKRTIEEQKLHDTAEASRHFARRDIDILLNKLRAENGDAVFVLPGWPNSIGATAEVAVGRWAMLPIIPIEDAE